MVKQGVDNKPLRILHIMSGFGGGISSFVKNKAEGLVDQSITFDVVTYDECSPAFVEAIEATGGSVYQLINPKKEGWGAFRQSFIRVLKQHHYDAVHCHISGYRAIPYRILLQRFNIPAFYIHAHLTLMRGKQSFINRIQTYLYQRLNRHLSDANVGCSKEAIYSTFGYDLADDQMMVIPNSIDSFSFIEAGENADELRAKHRQKFNIDENELLIGQIARLETVKNHEFTLRLAQYMNEHQLPGKIILLGDGNLKEEIQRKIEALGLSQRVLVAGRVQPITEFFPMLDVLFLPSLREGLPTVVVEAQASGIPTVMADTITTEVDLGLGMVQAVSLDNPLSAWYQAIVTASETQPPTMQKRLNRIKAENFTNESSARLYEQFLRGKVKSYLIGEKRGGRE